MITVYNICYVSKYLKETLETTLGQLSEWPLFSALWPVKSHVKLHKMQLCTVICHSTDYKRNAEVSEAITDNS